ncbi:Na/Pi cotransporter family protein [Rhodoflexus sp.]
MDWSEIQIWPVLAGLGLFLFGMLMMEEALKALTGRSFKKFLRKHTNNSIKAVLSGALITAILQSSSMVSLLVMSFAGAGIIGLKNGIGIIMGANLGTTMTGWLVSFIGFKLNIGAAILPFLAIGGLGTIFLKAERPAQFSKLLMGFSFMFMGLDYMKNGFMEFATHFDFSFLEGKPGILFTLIGMGLSAAIQSSSAAMMIILSSLAAGMVSLQQAFYLVVGSDIGTTVTAVIATINGNTMRRKVGWSQVGFNVVNALFAIIAMSGFHYLITEILAVKDPLIAVVVFHSLLNLSGIILLLPFLNPLTQLLERRIMNGDDKITRYLSIVSPQESHAASEALQKESIHFLTDAIRVNEYFFYLLQPGKGSANDAYFHLKSYETEVVEFYMQTLQVALTKEEATKINNMTASIRNATLSVKDLKDTRHNLEELSNSATDALYGFFKKLQGNQKSFYSELKQLLEHVPVVAASDIEQISRTQARFYQEEVDALYRIFSETREMNIASLLNTVRDINNSNESLLRSLTYLTASPMHPED